MWRWKRRGELSGSVPTRGGEERRVSRAAVAHAEMELAGDEGAIASSRSVAVDEILTQY